MPAVPTRPRSLRLSVIGTGYLGATHAASMAELGFTVVGYDTDPAKVAALSAGTVPFFEPGLPEMLERNIAAGRLSFTTDINEAVAGADVHFVCVGTPQSKMSHAADLSYVRDAVMRVVAAMDVSGLIVGKSTVPVGTAADLREMIAALPRDDSSPSVELVWNPEFLREGKAVQDTLWPDRIVIGGASHQAEKTLREVYSAALESGIPYIACDLPTAELVKVAANSFLATKISFINAMSTMCEAAGADVSVLADAIGHDVRIGREFLNAGLGFGGGCLPKDIRALMHRAGELGAGRMVSLMRQVDEINMDQRTRVVDLAIEACGGSVLNRRVTVLGAAFKPDTDDVRDSPALNVAAALHLRGAQVTVYDPQAGDTAKSQFPTLTYAGSVRDAVCFTDVVIVATEWPEFLELDPAKVINHVGEANLIDGRGKLDADRWRRAGWSVRTLGHAAV